MRYYSGEHPSLNSPSTLLADIPPDRHTLAGGIQPHSAWHALLLRYAAPWLCWRDGRRRSTCVE